jgi:transcription antitermination factor NusG
MQATQSLIDDGSWAVVACQVRRENETARWLQYFGSTIFLPKREIEIKATRHVTLNQRHRGLFRTVLRPLFPGYFFGCTLRGDPRDIPGFRCILRGGSVNQAVATLKGAANEIGLIKMPESKPQSEFSIGDVIQVTEGPFTAFGGIIVNLMPQRLDLEDRIRADIDIFGRLTPIELYIDQIKVVAKARHPKCSARPELAAVA